MTRVMADVDTVRSGIRDRSIRIIDVRKPQEYAKSHIPTALNLPLENLLVDDSPERMADLAGSLGIEKETPVVVYDNAFGTLASRVAWALEYLGHTGVTLLEIPYRDWLKMGLETDDVVPETNPAEYRANINSGMLAVVQDLESRNPGTTLVDSRERLNYLEQHIPGAISIPYRAFASANSILCGTEEMRRIFAGRNIHSDSDVITYCGSAGTLSGLAYYALKSIDVKNARLYANSFQEWKNLEKPTEKQHDANYWDLSEE